MLFVHMEFLTLVPALVTAFLLFFRSQGWVFLHVYLICLLALPYSFTWDLPGLPPFAFAYCAILPSAIVFIATHILKWKWSFTDLLIILYATWQPISEYSTWGYSKWADQLSPGSLTLQATWKALYDIVFPYMLAKGLIESHRFRVTAAKIFVGCLFFDFVMSLTEVFLGFNFWSRLFTHLFPGQYHGWSMSRYGISRLYGPFPHAIHMGLMMVVGYRFARWLEWNGLWKGRFRLLPFIPWARVKIMRVGMVLGAVLSVSRGPWIGAVASSIFIGAAKAKHKTAAIIGRSIILILTFTVLLALGETLVHMFFPDTTIAYRWGLIADYWEYALESPWFGYGSTGWSPRGGHTSIDNYYLLLFIQRGLPGLVLFSLILFYIGGRSIGRTLKYTTPKSAKPVLAFTFASIFICYFVTLGTVWIEDHTQAIFFVVVGWAEGYLLRRAEGVIPIAQTMKQLTSLTYSSTPVQVS